MAAAGCSRALRGPHVDKVLFAATKADHVPDIQRDHLAELLRNMAAFPAIEVKSSNAQIDVTALASVISTADDTQEIDGQRVQVVVGRPVGQASRRSSSSATCRSGRRGRTPGARRSSTCRCSSRRRSIRRRSTASRTSISISRSNSCSETGCDERSSDPRERDRASTASRSRRDAAAAARAQPAPQLIVTERTERVVRPSRSAPPRSR